MEDEKIEIINMKFDENLYQKNLQENEFSDEYEAGDLNENN
jgi:hypothetical protein